MYRFTSRHLKLALSAARVSNYSIDGICCLPRGVMFSTDGRRLTLMRCVAEPEAKKVIIPREEFLFLAHATSKLRLDRDEFVEKAFDSHTAGPVTFCRCGVTYWDSCNSGYSWESGERERLAADPKAKAMPHAIQLIVFEGTHYASDCTCWHNRAERIIGFLVGHQESIGEFFRLRKADLMRRAEKTPVIEAEEAA